MAEEDVTGTGGAVDPGDQGGDVVTDGAQDAAAATTAQTTEPDEFTKLIDPASLPPELKPHWTRMHGGYNKLVAKVREGQADLDLIKRYRSDPDFARQVIAADAQRFGFTLTPINGSAKPSTTSAAATQEGPPAQLVETMKAKLAPELHWLVDSIASAIYDGHRTLMEPLTAATRQQAEAAKAKEWEGHASKLSERAPGWEQHESTMLDLLKFLSGPDLTHPQHGSKLDILYNLATGNAIATRQAIERMGEAARNGSRTGQPGRTAATNIAEQVRGAKTLKQAFAIASRDAERQLREAGIAVPD